MSSEHAYAAVTARRMQWDSLLWQVPILSLTAQAFLFTIALAPETRRLPRVIACLLSVTVSVLTVHLMTRHRQAEIADARWLQQFEKRAFADADLVVHGPTWQARRNATDPDAWFFTPLARLPGFRVWAVGLALFGLAAALVLVLTLVSPALLEGAAVP